MEQQHKWTCCFPKVLSPTANPSLSDSFYPTHQLRYIYSCALFFAQASGQTERIFCQIVFHNFYLQQQIQVSWLLLTTHTNLSKLTASRPVSTPALSHTVRMFCQVVVFFTILIKDANSLQFIVAHTVLHKYGKFKNVCTFPTSKANVKQSV